MELEKQIETGIAFFDHMLDKLPVMDKWTSSKGDLEVDEHHTIEDTITLGEDERRT
jgi:imidazoleglycerol-phosphate dehydratase/histidinol-phosphatase